MSDDQLQSDHISSLVMENISHHSCSSRWKGSLIILMACCGVVSSAVFLKDRIFWRVTAQVALLACPILLALFWGRKRLRLSGSLLLPVLPALGLAVAVRLFCYTLLPPQQTIFEEHQVGELAASVIHSGDAGIEFRVTNLLGALSIAGRTSSLIHLRQAFAALSIIGLLFLLSATAQATKRIGTVIVVAVAAGSSRYLVMAGGVADEMYAPFSFVIILLCLIIGIDRSSEPRKDLSVLIGAICGIFMFEYTSYRTALLLVACYYAVRFFREPESRSSVVEEAAACLLGFCIVSLPVLHDLITKGKHAVFFEAFFRHGGERPTLLSENFALYAGRYLSMLFGIPYPETAYMTAFNPGSRMNDAYFPIPTALLFAGGFIMGLGSRRFIWRLFACYPVFLIAFASATANNAFHGRMLPAVAVLLILASRFLDYLSDRLEVWTGRSRLIRILFPLVVSLPILLTNLSAIERLRLNPAAVGEWANSPYSYFRILSEPIFKGKRVALVTPDATYPWPIDQRFDYTWVYEQNVSYLSSALSLEALPNPDSYDALLVGVMNRNLKPEELAILDKYSVLANIPVKKECRVDIAGRSNACFLRRD